MSIKKDEQQHLIKSMVHGKPNNYNTSNIYDIFNWQIPDTKSICHCQTNINKDNNSSKESLNKNIYQLEEKYYKEKQIQNYVQNKLSNQSPTQSYLSQKAKHLKPHQIKKTLYQVSQVHLKPSPSLQSPKTMQKPISSSPKKQDINTEEDKKMLETRKKKIKQFNRCTRDLSNSAFSAYYGKPVFQAYGRCNSSEQQKTHNVMPHRGQNHPQTLQTYEGALTIGKKIKISDHLPRKPLQTYQTNPIQQPKKTPQKASLPLNKPNLLTHIRFSQPKNRIPNKQPIPSQSTILSNKKANTKKNQKKQYKSTSQYYNDGLKYMNNRYHLINLLQQKKIKGTKLAYKVTQCYPEKQQNNNILIPAGIGSKKQESVQGLIYCIT